MARAETTAQVLARVRQRVIDANNGDLPPLAPTGAPVDLQVLAIRMKAYGYSTPAIARALDRHVATINRWIDDALEKHVAPDVERMRRVEDNRLDLYLEKLQPRIDRGDDKAINAAVRISERRSHLWGLNMPIKVDATIHELDEREIELQDMLNSAAARVAAEEAELARGQSSGS